MWFITQKQRPKNNEGLSIIFMEVTINTLELHDLSVIQKCNKTCTDLLDCMLGPVKIKGQFASDFSQRQPGEGTKKADGLFLVQSSPLPLTGAVAS